MGKFNDVDYKNIGIEKPKANSKNLVKLREKIQNTDYEAGEYISVSYKKIDPTYRNEDSGVGQIISVDGDEVTFAWEREMYRKKYKTHKIKKSEIEGKTPWKIGADSFVKEDESIRPTAYTLSSILYATGIMLYSHMSNERYTVKGVNGEDIPVMESNFNPFVIIDGEKKHFQRDFVWSKKDCQNLIESIYQGIDCGKVVLRKRSFDELRDLALQGETELAFKDVVDGKQRLTAIAKFIRDEYKDLHGNYFSDLSPDAKHKFMEHQLLSFAEMPEESSDEFVLRQFLKMNHFGVPQSKQHIEFVQSLYGKSL